MLALGVPAEAALALIVDADGAELADILDGVEAGADAPDQPFRVVLDMIGCGIELPVRERRDGLDASPAIDEKRARAGRALVDGKGLQG